MTGISSLGYDHVKLLGNTIEEITWHKAGIMKPGSITITSEHQPKTSLNILQKRAIEKKVNVILFAYHYYHCKYFLYLLHLFICENVNCFSVLCTFQHL